MFFSTLYIHHSSQSSLTHFSTELAWFWLLKDFLISVSQLNYGLNELLSGGTVLSFQSLLNNWLQILNHIQVRPVSRPNQDTYSLLLEKLGYHFWFVAQCKVLLEHHRTIWKILHHLRHQSFLQHFDTLWQSHHPNNWVQQANTMATERAPDQPFRMSDETGQSGIFSPALTDLWTFWLQLPETK